MKRSSFVVKMGRFYQNISPSLSFIDCLVSPFLSSQNKTFDTPIVVLLAPPRTGSTLTYQLITTSIKGFYLSNLWNVLAATPHLGGILSKIITKNHISDFVNQQGIVEGLSGESEGTFFFTHNTRQGLVEKDKDDEAKYLKFGETIQALGGNEDGAFLAGYMGHIFSINALRKVFKRIIFVHLTRDLVSNAVSLEKIAPVNWVSSRPKALGEIEKFPRETQIVKQLIEIHRLVLNNKKSDIVELNYQEICDSPKRAMQKIINKAWELYGIELKNYYFDILPEKLKYSFVENMRDEKTVNYANLFKQEINRLKPSERVFFEKLFIH